MEIEFSWKCIKTQDSFPGPGQRRATCVSFPSRAVMLLAGECSEQQAAIGEFGGSQ